MEDPLNSLNEQGGPTRPIHHTPHTWEEEFKRLEDNIREDVPFEGKWQSYVLGYRLIIPEELRHLFEAGGVLTVSTEKHLLLFGGRHWKRMNMILARDVGLSPVNNEVARHIYSHMYKFDRPAEDGSISLPLELVQYAGIKKDIAIIGMVYYAEIHDKDSYLSSESKANTESMLARFKKLRFN